jgi:hypothetical protein
MTDQIEQDAELDEEIEEALDTKNTEAQSFAANDKAEAAVKSKAKARKGDKSNSQPMQKMSGTASVKAENVVFDGDFSEDLNALVESEATLSEEFKAKTAIIFEAAVKHKLVEEINRLEEEYATQLDEEVSSIKADLVEKVDSYLDYVVEQWMEENKLAIQSGLRAEVAEGFMTKLKDLFVESYVEVPESKVDLVDELANANEELEEDFNNAVAKALKLTEELEFYKRKDIIREASRDLAQTQVEKLTNLAEGVTFESEKDFANKIATLKGSYFKTKTATSSIVENTEDDMSDDVKVLSGSMADYVAALRKTNK